MFSSNRLLAMLAIIIFLALALSSLVMAKEQDDINTAYQADYVVTEAGQTKLMTIWFDETYIAYSLDNSPQVALWAHWNSDHPTFFQVFSDVGYRIEYDRLTSNDMQPVLKELKLLFKEKTLQDKVSKGQKEFVLSSINNSVAVKKRMESWLEFKTYDYADIGDNEADPVLGKLINQGFVRSF